MASTVIDRATGVALISAIKAPCVAATTANITLYGEQTIDGVAVSAGDRVLVKNQTAAAENGVYVVDTGGWDRAPDFDSSRDIQQYVRVYIGAGSENANTEWVLTTDSPVPDTTALNFSRVHASGADRQAATKSALESLYVMGDVGEITTYGCLTAGDLGGGTWVRVASEPTHLAKIRSADRYLPGGVVSSSNGGWWELVTTEIRLQHFSHLVTNFGLATEDWLPAMNAARDYAVSKKVKMRSIGRTFSFYGQFTTKTGLHMVWDNLCWWYPKAWSSTGSVVTNVSTVVAERPQTDITIENPHIDGQYLPYDLASNDNALGFAQGAGRIHVVGGYIKNFAFSWSGGGAGGKAVNFEGGVYDSSCIGVTAENCGIGFFAQGYDGTWTTGELKGTRRIRFMSNIAVNCEAAAAVFGINTAADPDGDTVDSFIDILGLTFYNCGHAPNRPMSSDFQKSGAIVLGEAQNVTISGVRGHNTASYPASWPAGGSNVAGAGLSGAIGAVVWGWGRNITIRDVEYHGDCDALFRINRARALGDDAASTGTPENCYRIDVEIKHFGTADVAIDAHATSTYRPTNAEFTGRMEFVTDTISTGIVRSYLSAYTNMKVRVDDRSTGKSVMGTLASVYSAGNVFSSLNSGMTDLSNNYIRVVGQTITLADDAATSITPPAAYGLVAIASDASLLTTLVGFRTSGSAQTAFTGTAPASTAVTTGALAGTTGTDGNFTFSAHTDGKVYFENRRGGSVTFTVTFIG